MVIWTFGQSDINEMQSVIAVVEYDGDDSVGHYSQKNGAGQQDSL